MPAARWNMLLCVAFLALLSGSGQAQEQAPEMAATHPGAEAYPVPLAGQIAAAVKGRGPGYEPRTRHRQPDGSATYTNRLILEVSPYLLQHAHNPVNWYPWGDEAFETARRLGRPVLLSIGYSTCHWCHVMEEESFEDEEIAAFMNANYIAIKVDREERPDIDAIYMAAVQAISGRGGWPMTTWLNHDREPFYGGTYFPARTGDRGSRKGFLQLLGELHTVFSEQPDRVAGQAGSIRQRVERSMLVTPGNRQAGAAALQNAAESYKGSHDSVEGGLRQSPKFPSSLPMRFLLRYHERSEDQSYLDMVTLTLRKMARGGMYDQLAGGFHRYSTDSRWLVPHFEKMLYDNGLLTVAYLEGYQATGQQEFARIAREVLEYVSREMTSPPGGFYSATDADSLTPGGHREEGWFFTWTPQEIDGLLGGDAGLFKAYYNVVPGGNFEGRSILHVTRTIDEVAGSFNLTPEAAWKKIESSRKRLYPVRAKRPAPLRDDKILTAWNGLMISAFAQGGFVLNEPAFTERAERAAQFILDRMQKDGRLLRSFMDGRARHNAYLADYAFLIAGLLDLYETTSGLNWLEQAIALQATLDAHYLEEQGRGYYRVSDDHEALLARETPSRDGAEPSGNSVALMNLLRLHELTTDDRYRTKAEKLLRGFGPRLEQSPRRLPEMLLALDFHLAKTKEIVLVAAGSRESAEPFIKVLRESYLPNTVVAIIDSESDRESHGRVVPLTKGKVARRSLTTAYVCEQGLCKLPTTSVETFIEQLAMRDEENDASP